ncbi:sushi repeat-containing protein SRPX-like [Porites lutea]|uniref:sushi repeat-containing protein SRPX-like n=1 Tax=Porites lutea TaxID=51062 RepID=UPI003CC62FE9
MKFLQTLIATVFLTNFTTAAITDTEPPVFTYCPSDILIETVEFQVRVNWERPMVTDNSGGPPSLTPNRRSGSYFSAPGSYEVIYRAADSSGNVATCSFRITLKRQTCPIYPAPSNGALACLSLSDDPACAVMCKGGFDFVSDPALLYLCSRGQWIMLRSPQEGGLPWPSCFEVTHNHTLKMDQFPQYYFDGNAPNVLDTIKTNFISLLGDFGFCTDVQKCTKDLVNVDVGKPSST